MASLQGLALLLDELYCHHKRGLSQWERNGHPIDTLFFAFAFFVMSFEEIHLAWVIGACALSCLVILKDEWVHVHCVDGFESFLHAFLFVLHPVTLICAYWAATSYQLHSLLFWLGMILTIGAGVQWTYWHFRGPRADENIRT